MSRNYDNWERLVAAVLKKEQLWQLFHAQSVSPSISSGSSGFPSPEWSAYNQKEGDFVTETDKATPSSILVEDQTPAENPSTNKNVERSENSPKISPQNTSPASGSAVHFKTGGGQSPPTNRHDNSKQESHPLPLPAGNISNVSRRACLKCKSGFETATISPLIPLRSLENAESLKSSTPPKNAKFLAGSALGGVDLGFNSVGFSEKGERCTMKEFSLFLGDAMSKQNSRMLRNEISLLISLKHPNIVQYYGSEMVGDNLNIFNEYISGGSIYMILQEYGKLGESAIRSYTQQILSGLSYLHSKSIPHSNIRGVSIFVDSNSRVKLANFGIEKHIFGQNYPSLLADNSYWRAPEVILNSNARNLACDIWSLGCTIIEMATSKPPNSQHSGAIAMLKVAYHREVPDIPDHLAGECKDFLRHCLQWNPQDRATATQLLEHPFVKSSSSLKKRTPSVCHSQGIRHARSHHQLPSA